MRVVLLREGHLCNFKKGNNGIKKIIGVQEEYMGVEEEFVHYKKEHGPISPNSKPTMSLIVDP